MHPSASTSVDSEGRNRVIEDKRPGSTVEALKRGFTHNLFFAQSKFRAIATKHDFYMALAYTVRDLQLHH